VPHHGAEIFNLTLSAVPQSVNSILEKSGRSLDEIDLFVIHQANQYMLDHLRKRLEIPAEKVLPGPSSLRKFSFFDDSIALKHGAAEGRLSSGARVLLVGFGVGYSWATILRSTEIL
jgi:3-oxoacyl-[acyl-carrier-protein] synthase III